MARADNTENDTSSAYRPELDGLRALAIIAVIANHFSPSALPNGYLGVDIFFVISGFVITGSLARLPDGTLTSFLLHFYSKRIKRLVPALILCVAVTAILICLVDYRPVFSLVTGITSLFGLSNLFLYRNATDYFGATAAMNVFTQTWSLGVEEQFYLIFPVLLWMAGFGRRPIRVNFALLPGVAMLSAVSLWIFVRGNDSNPAAAYYLMPSRFWELGAGCLVYLAGLEVANRALAARTGLSARAISICTFCSPVLLALVLAIPSLSPVHTTPAVVVLTAIMIAGIRPGTALYRCLTYPAAVSVGLASYSLYLWHWTVLTLSRWTVGIHWWLLPFQLGLVVALAGISYRYVEKPLRRAKWSCQNWRTVLYGFAGLSSAAGAVLLLNANSTSLFVKNYNVIAPPDFRPLIASSLPFNPTCVVDGVSRTLHANTFDLCTVQPRLPNRQMLYASGDSHAGHLQGLIYAVHDRIGMGVHLVETPGFTFPLRTGTTFPARIALYDDALKKAAPGDIFLLSRLYLDRSRNPAPSADLPSWYEDVAKLAASLAEKHLNVVVVGPTPMFQFDNVGICRENSARENVCAVPRASLAGAIDPVHHALEAIARRSGNLYIYEPFLALCPETGRVCSPVRNGTALFRDRDHLNVFGAESLADDFIQFLYRNRLVRP